MILLCCIEFDGFPWVAQAIERHVRRLGAGTKNAMVQVATGIFGVALVKGVIRHQSVGAIKGIRRFLGMKLGHLKIGQCTIVQAKIIHAAGERHHVVLGPITQGNGILPRRSIISLGHVFPCQLYPVAVQCHHLVAFPLGHQMIPAPRHPFNVGGNDLSNRVSTGIITHDGLGRLRAVVGIQLQFKLVDSPVGKDDLLPRPGYIVHVQRRGVSRGTGQKRPGDKIPRAIAKINLILRRAKTENQVRITISIQVARGHCRAVIQPTGQIHATQKRTGSQSCVDIMTIGGVALGGYHGPVVGTIEVARNQCPSGVGFRGNNVARTHHCTRINPIRRAALIYENPVGGVVIAGHNVQVNIAVEVRHCHCPGVRCIPVQVPHQTKLRGGRPWHPKAQVCVLIFLVNCGGISGSAHHHLQIRASTQAGQCNRPGIALHLGYRRRGFVVKQQHLSDRQGRLIDIHVIISRVRHFIG